MTINEMKQFNKPINNNQWKSTNTIKLNYLMNSLPHSHILLPFIMASMKLINSVCLIAVTKENQWHAMILNNSMNPLLHIMCINEMNPFNESMASQWK